MELVLEILVDALKDTGKLLPFLFLTYLALEALEHKAGDRAKQAISKAGNAGPAIGAVLGVFPQCGFSAAAATFYAGRVITLGTLFAIFLSTSDEMLPILIAQQADIAVILKILGAKLLIGMVMGFLVDGATRILKRRNSSAHEAGEHSIHILCEQDKCDCHKGQGGILKSSLKHTLQVTLFIFLITLALNAIIAFVGEDMLVNFLSANPALSIFASALVGLIPNCGASVVITQLYLEGALSSGALIAGLLVSAGVGLLVLFRANRRLRENLALLAGLYATGVLWGLLIAALGIVF
ncbi:MAG: arsenic efflux protein [Eggerthellaceae bacterium]|jgi:hypothetical protein|nr:arsenic efflux protein [Eggerthellaceae bacterium]MDR2721568.1 arsenic efflux protein [Coriobacteriaceae bacterium]